MMNDEFSDKIVLVSAGGSGIGAAISAAFMHSGATVHICDIDQGLLDIALSDGIAASASLCDVSSPDQVAQLLSDVESRYGRLDILVNNAGIAGPTAAVEDVAIEDWDRTIQVDLSGAFYMTRSAVPLLKKAGAGSIINMSSVAGVYGYEARSPYVAAKWALVGLTKGWAMELGRHGIRVNAICPGCVDGPRIEAVIERDALTRGSTPEQVREVYQRQSSLRRFIKADEIANMALYLASEAGSGISGQAMVVDGNTEGTSS
ncbi:MAG: NAD(P)-dependent dehydrogenase (short-subunit alcohol dehydrogenase family) [Planctomycetota bacterium]|jgi:NAD(P)-dependent dehydrogenase (short-subunit alcohol dehydrogenase family)